MKKIVLFVVAALLLTSCGWFDRNVTANLTGYSRECIDGVMYYQFASGVTVAYTADGKIKTCK